MSHKRKRIKSPKHSLRKTLHFDETKIDKAYESSIRESKLSFSFQYLNLRHKSFNVLGCKQKWFIQLLNRKKDYCTMTPQEIKMGGKSTRYHPIGWEETSESRGFGIKGLSEDIDECQLSISKRKGRILGFFIDTIFYIVWFDPDHNLYS